MTGSTEPRLTTEDLGISYTHPSEVKVFEHVDLTITQGKIVLITGKNGSGKSTLISTLLQAHAKGSIKSSGRIKILKGETLNYLSQKPAFHLLTQRVDEELASPLGFKRVPREERRHRVIDVINQFNFKPTLERNPLKLSSGEQQLLLLMVGKISDSDIFLLDEPFSMLDKTNEESVISALNVLKGLGKSIVVVSHRPPLNLLKYIDNIFLIEDFRLKQTSIPTFKNHLEHLQEFVNSLLSKSTQKERNLAIYWDSMISVGRAEMLFQCPPMNINSGEIVCFSGSNGSGKTTFLLTLHGSISPLEGSVTKKAKTKFVPADPLLFFMDGEIKSLLKEYKIDKMDIPNKFKSVETIFQLSEGQQKLFGLFLVFFSDTEILLLDEPTFALDSENIKLLLKWLSETEKTVIIASHEVLLFGKLPNKSYTITSKKAIKMRR